MFNSVQIVGFLGKDPERREARSNGAAFTILSVATQRSWKNAEEEWTSKVDWHRVVVWNALGERVAETVRKGDLVLVAGRLVSRTYDREIGKGKKATTVKQTVWQIRASSIRKLSRGEKEPQATASASGDESPSHSVASSEDAPF
jgi:single-strand DNA-binding protein